MKARFKNIDRYTEMFLPHNLQEWLPKNDLARFVVDCIEGMSLTKININMRGTGSEQYPPKMMLSLLIYCYAEGIFSSRKIEKASYRDIAVRFICGGNHHPDHDTICSFRVKNKALLAESFIEVLQLANELGLLNVGKVSLDGTKIKANASKHKAVSYDRAGKKIKQLEKEVKELLLLAQKEDNKNEDDDMSIPEELSRREIRLERLHEARKRIEERAKTELKEKQKNQRNDGQKPRKKAEDENPGGKDQINFTDEESRIMKAGNGKHFEQAYNAQCCVDTEGSQLIIGQYVTNHANDKQEIEKAINNIPDEVGEVIKVCADNGYLSKKKIIAMENNLDGNKVKCYVSMGKNKHGRTLAQIKKEHKRISEKNEFIKESNFESVMTRRLASKEGHQFYKKRKETVEPVFGIIKHVMGFRQFLMRGLDKVSIEWDLVTIAYNMKRLHKMRFTQQPCLT